MSVNKPGEHPEIEDMKNICDVAPDTKHTHDVCDKMKEDSAKTAEKEKNDKELDKELKETFPASDPITKY
ncbi:MAG: hypothetical protein PSV35_06190 [bacterium]|nr:hypothetical protein [bacterium]